MIVADQITKFMIQNNLILEIIKVEDPLRQRSWIVEDSVVQGWYLCRNRI